MDKSALHTPITPAPPPAATEWSILLHDALECACCKQRHAAADRAILLLWGGVDLGSLCVVYIW